MFCVAVFARGSVLEGSVIFNKSEDAKQQTRFFDQIEKSGAGVQVVCWGVDGCEDYAGVLNVTCEEYGDHNSVKSELQRVVSTLDWLANRGCIINRADQEQMFVNRFSDEEFEKIRLFLSGASVEDQEGAFMRLVAKIQELDERVGPKAMLAISVAGGALVGLFMSGVFVAFCVVCCLSE